MNTTTTQYEGTLTYVDEYGNEYEMYPDIKTDETLTVRGKAADAAETGNRLASVENMANNTQNIANSAQNIANSAQTVANDAKDIAKGKNKARVFSTTEAMQTWLSDSINVGLCNIGDNIYIIDIGVPDWWISEVLTEADPETGYYYKIAKLETQKVDLTTIEEEIAGIKSDASELNKKIESQAFFPNYSADSIATITTAGGSWIATKDCCCVAKLGSTSTGVTAIVYVDELEVASTVSNGNSDVTYNYVGCFYVKKGQTIKTRNVGGANYLLNFKPLF